MENIAFLEYGRIDQSSINIYGRLLLEIFLIILVFFQEFEDLWPKLDKVFDDGMLGDTYHSRQGSTVVDLSEKGTYKIIRDGR